MRITEKMIMKRIIDWGLDIDSDDDYYIAEESLYFELNGSSIQDDALNEGVI